MIVLLIVFCTWVILLLVEAGIARRRDEKLEKRIKWLEDNYKAEGK
jgi:hypothetical protein